MKVGPEKFSLNTLVKLNKMSCTWQIGRETFKILKQIKLAFERILEELKSNNRKSFLDKINVLKMVVLNVTFAFKSS